MIRLCEVGGKDFSVDHQTGRGPQLLTSSLTAIPLLNACEDRSTRDSVRLTCSRSEPISGNMKVIRAFITAGNYLLQ